MPGPHVHLLSVVPFLLGARWLNVATLVLASIFPDVIPILLSPILTHLFSLRGPALNAYYTFFDQTLVGGLVSVLILAACIAITLRRLPGPARLFTWRQHHSAGAILASSCIGVFVHVLLDTYPF